MYILDKNKKAILTKMETDYTIFFETFSGFQKLINLFLIFTINSKHPKKLKNKL